MPVRQEIREGRVPVRIYTGDIKPSARQQLVNLSRLPIVHHHVAAMPDVHLGIGATVGSVIPTLKAIIPAAVGVDIGCGMIAARTTLRASDLPDDLRALRTAIEAAVPHGRTANGGPGDRGAWGVPFYLDVGTGKPKFTWQAAAGVSYAFGWGELSALWRYLDYENKSGKPIKDVQFSGPMVGATFRW